MFTIEKNMTHCMIVTVVDDIELNVLTVRFVFSRQETLDAKNLKECLSKIISSECFYLSQGSEPGRESPAWNQR